MGKRRKSEASLIYTAEIPSPTFVSLEIDLADHMSDIEVELSEEDIIQRVPLCEPYDVLAELDHDDIFTFLLENGEPEALRLALVAKFGAPEASEASERPQKSIVEQVRCCSPEEAQQVINVLVKFYAVEMSAAVHDYMRSISIR